jgi:hypothetical protein
VAGSGVRLMLPSPDRPAQSQVNSMIVFSGEGEQPSDLTDGEPDQAAARPVGHGVGTLLSAVLFCVVCAVRLVGLSTGGGPLF